MKQKPSNATRRAGAARVYRPLAAEYARRVLATQALTLMGNVECIAYDRDAGKRVIDANGVMRDVGGRLLSISNTSKARY